MTEAAWKRPSDRSTPEWRRAQPIGQCTESFLFLGDFPLARSTAERAVKINEAVLGPHHPDVASDLLELARVLKEQNDLVAAQFFFFVPSPFTRRR
jgi:hypothetical protein